MEQKFNMVAKTLKGLEAVLADELRALGAEDVAPGRRMVSFRGDLETLYKANLCCRTALRILKPFYSFKADDADTLYDRVKEFDWGSLMTLDKTFAIDTVVNSDTFKHSRYVTYRVKDAIVDWFRDRYGDKRPGVRLTDADVIINVHINGGDVTLSLDSSGESLHKRGYRTAQTEAPISEVLAAGIILMSGYRGQCPFVDPMCGSGTFLIEAALIAANIMPGVYRKNFAFEHWPDFDAELFERLWNDDSAERPVEFPIIGADISPTAVDIARRNIRSAGVGRYINLEVKPISQWTEAPVPAGILVTNPPYGERISAPDMDALYQTIGSRLKHVFPGWHAWIIGYREEYFEQIGLAPSEKVSLMNGSLDCELREYVIFEGNKRDFRAAGGKLKHERKAEERKGGPRRPGERRPWERGSRPADRRRDDDRDRRPEAPATPEADPENPLARRRNPHLLDMTMGRQPSLPRTEGPVIRPRGWKKKD
ncbi:MAG: THUMP domain-containing protein [Muribaculaceae bacterium]|nr:THUMP domain-containing protein [Muribaculaceae bacterium]